MGFGWKERAGFGRVLDRRLMGFCRAFGMLIVGFVGFCGVIELLALLGFAQKFNLEILLNQRLFLNCSGLLETKQSKRQKCYLPT